MKLLKPYLRPARHGLALLLALFLSRRRLVPPPTLVSAGDRAAGFLVDCAHRLVLDRAAHFLESTVIGFIAIVALLKKRNANENKNNHDRPRQEAWNFSGFKTGASARSFAARVARSRARSLLTCNWTPRRPGRRRRFRNAVQIYTRGSVGVS